MTRELRKAIMEKTRLKNLYYKNKSEIAKINYKLQSFCVSPKKQFFNNLSKKDINDKKQFRKTVKPFLNKKKNSMKKNNEIVKDDAEIANIFNEYFSTITKGISLTAPPCSEVVIDVGCKTLCIWMRPKSHKSFS